MNAVNEFQAAVGDPPQRGASELSLINIALRQKWCVLLFAALVATVVYGYERTILSSYSSEVSVLVDARQVQVLGADRGLVANQLLDEMWTRTEMEVLNSLNFAESVVKRLDLSQYPQFQDCSKAGGLMARLRRLSTGAPAPACARSDLVAAKILLNTVATFEADRSAYLIHIGATTHDRQLSSDIANTYGAMYVQWQQDSADAMAGRANKSLSFYVDQMHDRMVAADAEVEKYRESHNLVQLHRDNAADSGTDTVRTQSLSDTNTALTEANAQLAEKQGVLDQVQSVLHSGGRVEAVGPVLDSPLIQTMLAKRVDVAATLDDLRARYGDAYPAVQSQQAQLTRTDQSIRNEVMKTVSSLSGQVSALRARRDFLAAHVAGLEQAVGTEGRADVQLQELLHEAQTQTTAYEAMLSRLKEIGAERMVQQGGAQVVVEAVPADLPSGPKRAMTTAGAFMAALGAGLAFAIAREFFSSRFRDATQVEDETGLLVLGLFPTARRYLPQDVILKAPLSPEADCIHSALNQIMGRPGGPDTSSGTVALITSSVAGEGKTSFTVALGRTAAQCGMSVFLLDADLRRPSLGRMLGARPGTSARPGDLVPGPAEMLDRVSAHKQGDLPFLSLGDYISSPHDLRTWSGFTALMLLLRSRYDLVLIDTPPVLAVPDVLQMGYLVDQVVLMIDWRGAARTAVKSAMMALGRAGMPATSAVMSKVDLKQYARAGSADTQYLHYFAGYQRSIAAN